MLADSKLTCRNPTLTNSTNQATTVNLRRAAASLVALYRFRSELFLRVTEL